MKRLSSLPKAKRRICVNEMANIIIDHDIYVASLENLLLVKITDKKHDRAKGINALIQFKTSIAASIT